MKLQSSTLCVSLNERFRPPVWVHISPWDLLINLSLDPVLELAARGPIDGYHLPYMLVQQL